MLSKDPFTFSTLRVCDRSEKEKGTSKVTQEHVSNMVDVAPRAQTPRSTNDGYSAVANATASSLVVNGPTGTAAKLHIGAEAQRGNEPFPPASPGGTPGGGPGSYTPKYCPRRGPKVLVYP